METFQRLNSASKDLTECLIYGIITSEVFPLPRSPYFEHPMEKNLAQQTTALIARDFGLEIGEEPLTEQQLFDLVADQVAYMLEHRMESLFSLMYRLDVAEQKIREALAPDALEAANTLLARLIIERQKQRIRTKQQYRQEKLDDLGDLAY